MSLPRYREYRDIGSEWLGAAPAHWPVKRLRFIVELNPSKSELAKLPQDTEVSFLPMEAIGDDGSLNLEKRRALQEVETGYTYFRDGDVAVAKITPCFENGKGALMAGLLGGIGFGTTELIVARPKSGQVSAEFLNWIFQSPGFRKQGEAWMYGAGGQKRVPDDFVRNCLWCLPPITEQKAISAFLDRETNKIDALIGEQKKLLALLAEMRQATISHAVTRGLNPDAPMNDSGVEWLAVIPKHWNVIRLAQLFHEISEPGEDALPILSVSIHDGVSDGELDEDEMERKVTRSDDRSKYKRVAPGDLVYNMMRAWQGGFGSVEVPGMVSPAYVVARPIGSNFVTGYIERLLRTAAGAKEAKRYSKGVTDFRLRLYWDEFKNICVPLPPKGEQVAIMHALDDSNARIDGLATEARTVISLLRERRAALISAAVTGNIDVRKHPSALAAAA